MGAGGSTATGNAENAPSRRLARGEIGANDTIFSVTLKKPLGITIADSEFGTIIAGIDSDGNAMDWNAVRSQHSLLFFNPCGSPVPVFCDLSNVVYGSMHDLFIKANTFLVQACEENEFDRHRRIASGDVVRGICSTNSNAVIDVRKWDYVKVVDYFLNGTGPEGSLVTVQIQRSNDAAQRHRVAEYLGARVLRSNIQSALAPLIFEVELEQPVGIVVEKSKVSVRICKISPSGSAAEHNKHEESRNGQIMLRSDDFIVALGENGNKPRAVDGSDFQRLHQLFSSDADGKLRLVIKRRILIDAADGGSQIYANLFKPFGTKWEATPYGTAVGEIEEKGESWWLCACVACCLPDAFHFSLWMLVAGAVREWNQANLQDKQIKKGDYVVAITAAKAKGDSSKHGADVDEASGLQKIQGLPHEQVLALLDESPSHEVRIHVVTLPNSTFLVHLALVTLQVKVKFKRLPATDVNGRSIELTRA